jgi:hypothetical protein
MGVTLRKKPLSNGRQSLYIDYCYKGKRKKEVEYLSVIYEVTAQKAVDSLPDIDISFR